MPEAHETARRVGILDAITIVASQPRVAIRALPAEARFALRLAANEAGRIGRIGNLSIAMPINRTAQSGECLAVRLGPDEFLVIAPPGAAANFQAEASAALAGVHHALTDISHRHVAFEVAGWHAADVLNAGCALDLGRLVPGDGTRTLLGKVEIVLVRLADDDRGMPRFRIECWRSFGRYLHAFLTEAAREYGVS